MKNSLIISLLLFIGLGNWSCEEDEPEDCAGVAGGDNICGCTDSTATNYNSTATFDDESCEYDTVDCSTVESYYDEQIAPILSSNCTGCHSGSTPTGDLSLDSYESVYTAIKSGNVLDRVNRNEGASGFMPDGGTKLSDANLDILQTFFEMECDE